MPQNNRMLYRKVGRRYEPVGEDFTGFPADGVWYVQNDRRRRTHIMKIGDLPDPRPLVEREQFSFKRLPLHPRVTAFLYLTPGEVRPCNLGK